MKSNDRQHIYEFDDDPRETRYEVEMLLQTGDGVEPYHTMHADSPPLVPDEGDHVTVDWLEDETGTEVEEPVRPDEIGSDEPYSVLTSPTLEVIDVRTNYSKRDYHDELGTNESVLTVHKTVLRQLPLPSRSQ